MGTSSFHLSNFERILRSQNRVCMGPSVLKPWINLWKASLTYASKYDNLQHLIFSSMTSFLGHGNGRIEKNLGAYVLILVLNSRFETTHMVFMCSTLRITLLCSKQVIARFRLVSPPQNLMQGAIK